MLRKGMPFRFRRLNVSEPETGQLCYFVIRRKGGYGESFSDIGYYRGNNSWYVLYDYDFRFPKKTIEYQNTTGNLCFSELIGRESVIVRTNPQKTLWFPVVKPYGITEADDRWTSVSTSYPNYPDQCFVTLDVPGHGRIVDEAVYDGNGKWSRESASILWDEELSRCSYIDTRDAKVTAWMLDPSEYYGGIDPWFSLDYKGLHFRDGMKGAA